MRQRPHLAPSALCQLLTASPLHPDPHPGQLASLFVGQPPTWKTNLRKCQRTGKGGRSGGGSKARGNGSVGSRVESFWGNWKETKPHSQVRNKWGDFKGIRTASGRSKRQSPSRGLPTRNGVAGGPH